MTLIRLALLTLAPGLAHAAEVFDGRPDPRPPTAALSPPPTPAATAGPVRRLFIGPAGPAVGTPEAARAASSRVLVIERLTGLINDSVCSGGVDPAIMLLHLARLYVDEGEYQVALAGDGDLADATRWLDKAVRLYRQILKYYPRSEGLDEAQFHLGYALLLLGDAGGALDAWKQLLQAYPDSTFAPAAYVGVGDVFLERGELYKSIAAYHKAAAVRDGELWPWASYRLGCYVGDYGMAVETLREVVDAGHPVPDDRTWQAALRARAEADLAWFEVRGGASG